jgi:hypothetical protein
MPRQGTGASKKLFDFARKENRIKQILFSPISIMFSFSLLPETVAVVAVVSGPQTPKQIAQWINKCFHTHYKFDSMWGNFQKPDSNQVTTKAVMDIMREHKGIFSLVEEKDGTLTVVGIDPEIRESIETGQYKSAYLVAQITIPNLSRR